MDAAYKYDNIKLNRNVIISWDVESPLTPLINEDKYKLVELTWCGDLPSVALEAVPQMSTVAQFINDLCNVPDEEDYMDDKDKLAIISNLSAELAIVLDGIYEYNLEQAERCEISSEFKELIERSCNKTISSGDKDGDVDNDEYWF